MPTYGAFGDGDECASDNIFPPKEPNPLQLRMEAAKKEMLSPAGDNVTPKSLDELEGLLGGLEGLKDDMPMGEAGMGEAGVGGDMDIDALMAQLQDMQAGQEADGQAFDQSYAGQPGYEPQAPPPPGGHGDGYRWTSDELQVLVRLPLPPGATAKRLKVDVSATAIKVTLGERVLLAGKLGGKCAPDNTFWTLEDDETAGAQEGSKVLAVDVEKAKGGMPWAHFLQGEKDALLAQVTDRVWLELAVNGTSVGTRLEVGLFGARCPQTAANFKALCAGDGAHQSTAAPGQALAFKGSAFHRIIPGFMLQGGDITAGDGTGGESIYGPKFDDEDFSLGHAAEGLLSMANSGPNSCGSQFFLTTAAAPWLDGKHTVFGRVLSGYAAVVPAAESCGSRSGAVSGTVTIADCGVVEE